jgi:pimeloyl-ACP methyl ester carboxylesterase
MDRFTSYDGTDLAFRRNGAGPPLVCLPGGPGLNPDYLGDLGGLADYRELVLLEARGTGASAVPADPASYRCDRQVGDVEALRAHLGLDRMDLLGHSAAANLAMLYAAACPERLDHLVLLTPGLRAVGLEAGDEEVLAAAECRAGEPWYPAARAALLASMAGEETIENLRVYVAFFYGRWDDAARQHARVEFEQRVPAVEAGYYAEGAFDPAATRAALGKLTAPVLVYAGGLDVAPTPERAARLASLFPDAHLDVQPGGGHFPWLDDPARLGGAIESFLG